jgi:hypothetical protein
MIVLNNGQRSNNIRLTKKGGKDAQGEMTAFAKYERSFSISRTSETGQCTTAKGGERNFRFWVKIERSGQFL